jgi:chemotaxis response regulator CheB
MEVVEKQGRERGSLAEELNPDVVIMDTPPELNGIDATARL